MPKHLLVLDLDETLIHAAETPTTQQTPWDFQIFSYFIWKRPYLSHFLTTIFDWFDVAVWTSSSDSYAQAIVSHIFEEPQRLAFVWTRTRCTQCYDRDSGLYYWRKNLNKVKRVTRRPLEQILMLDDTPEKLERHYGNIVQLTSFEGNHMDTELHDILPYLNRLRIVENVRVVEKRYWRVEHAPPITISGDE